MLPTDIEELPLAFFGLARAYLRLATLARRGRVGDEERKTIENESLDALFLAAMVEEHFGAEAQDRVPQVQQTLLALFENARRGWH